MHGPKWCESTDTLSAWVPTTVAHALLNIASSTYRPPSPPVLVDRKKLDEAFEPTDLSRSRRLFESTGLSKMTANALRAENARLVRDMKVLCGLSYVYSSREPEMSQ